MSVDYHIIGVVFDNNEPGFDRMIKAFEKSVLCNAPHAQLRIVHTTRPLCEKGYKPTYPDNTRKLHVWRDEVHKAEIPMVLLDVDMLILHELIPAFDEAGGNWDIGITVRPHRMWINAGAIYAKPTQGARDFMDAWCEVNDRLYSSRSALSTALKRHNGLNQTAMLHMLEECGNHPRGCKVHKLQCTTWNNCDQTWKDFDLETTAALHIKGGLRRYALEARKLPVPKNIRLPLKVWDVYDSVS